MVLYDIACLLETHLRVSPIMFMLYTITIVVQNRGRTDLLDKTTFGVPIFHVYGHGAFCQVSYNYILVYTGSIH